MADIKQKMKELCGIDITQTNLIKLYKIDNPDLSSSELETKLAAQRDKWERSVNNGVNERIVERDRKLLEKADAFEKVLRDPKLRKELYAFHTGKGGKGEEAGGEVSPLVKRYFSLVASTTKIGKDERDFFIKYFPEEKKHKRSITEYLKKEYKALITSIGTSDSDDTEEKPATEPVPEPKKRKSSGIIQNLFTEKTLLELRACELKFKEAQASAVVAQHLPDASKSFYEFLNIGAYKNTKEYGEYLTQCCAKVADIRKDFGNDFLPLIDIYNSLADMMQNSDVRDNFPEFRLLVMYPALTPYMFKIREIKKDSLDKLYEMAASEYSFLGLPDFMITYFNVIYDNFGIYEDGIRKIMKNAEKQAGRVKAMNAVSNLLGVSVGNSVPLRLMFWYILAYWPVYLLSGIFYVFKFIAEKLRYVGVALAAVIVLFMMFSGVDSSAEIELVRGGFHWVRYLQQVNGLQYTNFLAILLSSVEAIAKILFKYFAIGGVVGRYLWVLSVTIRNKIDLKGIERSFELIFKNAKSDLMNRDRDNHSAMIKYSVIMGVSNLLGVAVVAALIRFLPGVIRSIIAALR